MRYRIDGFELDSDARTLTGPDGPVHVEPQVFDVLAHLVVNRHRAVPKAELLDEIWGDQFVSESALTTRIKSVRVALGDNGREQRHIRTVHGFGYQFVSDVETLGSRVARDHTNARARTEESLPRFHTPLRGREDERREVASLVARYRVVTLLGPGGIGKTRLAVEVASELESHHATGALPPIFVDLATIRDPRAVPDTIASALAIEIGQRRDPIDAVCEFLDALPHLVLIDNCEHVLAAVNAAIVELVNGTGGTRILATSREPLGLAGERLYRLGPLPLLGVTESLTPEVLTRNPAVAMFLDRAQLRGEELMVDGADAEHIVELCRTLEGLPLALELAAGRVSAFGLADLVGLLDRRLDVLGDRSSGREHRHRTLRSTVEWSYDLLDDDERRLFRSLAVFPAGVTIEAIDWLTDRLGLGVSGLEAAARLVDASLLVRHRAPSGSRYTLLETLRAFGLERLVASRELETVLDVAVAFTLDLLRRAEAGLQSPDEALWVDRVRRELPNLQAARIHLVASDRTDELLELSRRLVGWARLRDATEVWAWSDDLLDRCAAGDPRRATALAVHAQAAWRRGDVAGAIEDASAALDRAADDWTESQARSELGAALLFSGDLAGAAAVWTGPTAGEEAWALGSAAVAVAYSGDIGTARGHAARARELALASASPSMTAWIDFCAVEVENTVGSADLTALDRAIDEALRVDATFIVGVARLTHASVHVARGNLVEAARSYAELIRHWLRSGSWVQMWTTLRHVAELLEASHPRTALAILRAARSDRLSPPALIDASSDRLAALAARLERRFGSDVEDAPTRVEVVELALAALSERSE